MRFNELHILTYETIDFSKETKMIMKFPRESLFRHKVPGNNTARKTWTETATPTPTQELLQAYICLSIEFISPISGDR